MQKIFVHIIFILIIIGEIMLLHGCSYVKTHCILTKISIEAKHIIDHLYSINHDLKTLKGIGTITIHTKQMHFKARAAWNIMFPDKIRISIVDFYGQPIETIASDGKYLYVLSHKNTHSFYKKRSLSLNLEGIISIPLTSTELITILAGTMPSWIFDTATIEKNNNTLLLGRYWDDQHLKVNLTIDRFIHNYSVLENFSDTLYQVSYKDTTPADNFRIPKSIYIDSQEHGYLDIHVDRFWVNTPISQDVFGIMPTN
ncbi:MAG: DUF4292 domain-containing protein [Desulfobacterales bacterium]|nr:DUF4292 domain-containing protein [Desulfobacterales bacterium]